MGQGKAGSLRRRLCHTGPPHQPTTARVDRGQTGEVAGVAAQPRENARVELATDRPEPGFPGLHLSVRPRPIRARRALLEPATIPQGDGAGTGGAAATGQPTAEPYTPAGTDRATEPTLARLGQLFWTGLSAQGVSADQSFRAGPLGTTPAPTQSAWLAWPARS